MFGGKCLSFSRSPFDLWLSRKDKNFFRSFFRHDMNWWVMLNKAHLNERMNGVVISWAEQWDRRWLTPSDHCCFLSLSDADDAVGFLFLSVLYIRVCPLQDSVCSTFELLCPEGPDPKLCFPERFRWCDFHPSARPKHGPKWIKRVRQRQKDQLSASQ